MASARPRSIMTLPYSTRFTVPLNDIADAILVFFELASRSASRTFCTITCLAFCAAMRPKSSGGNVSAIKSPASASGLRFFGVLHSSSAWRRAHFLNHFKQTRQFDFARARDRSRRGFRSRCHSEISRPSGSRLPSPERTILLSIVFSRATASAICKSSSRFALIPACAIVQLRIVGSSFFSISPPSAHSRPAGLRLRERGSNQLSVTISSASSMSSTGKPIVWGSPC